MAFKKQEWSEMKRSGLMFELTVRDQDWKKLETIKINPSSFTKTMKDIGNRYGIESKMLTPNKDFEEEIGFLRDAKII